MNVINAGSQRHRQQLEYLALFLRLESIEYVDHGIKEELILTRADGQTLRVHAAANFDKEGFFVVDVPGMKPLESMPGPESPSDLMPARKAGRCTSGAQRDGGVVIHLVKRGDLPRGHALCGAQPGSLSAGWSTDGLLPSHRSCKGCEKVIQPRRSALHRESMEL